MKRIVAFVFVALLPACDPELRPFPGTVEPGALVGLFEGRFPCTSCERLKTAIALLQDPTTQAPAAYRMREVYVGQDDTPRDTVGTWTITRGAPASPDTPIYELHPDGSA